MAVLLVLCPRCYDNLHPYPVPLTEQREPFTYRPYRVKQAIRAIPGYRPKPCAPPDDIDPATVFEAMECSAHGCGV